MFDIVVISSLIVDFNIVLFFFAFQLNSPPIQPSLGPWILGGAPNYPSSMSSSIVSNSSTGEFSSDFYQKNFVVAYHRKMVLEILISYIFFNLNNYSSY